MAEIHGQRALVNPALVPSARALCADALDIEHNIAAVEEELRRREHAGRQPDGARDKLEIAFDLWRAQQWARPNARYRIRRLDADEEVRKRALLEGIGAS